MSDVKGVEDGQINTLAVPRSPLRVWHRGIVYKKTENGLICRLSNNLIHRPGSRGTLCKNYRLDLRCTDVLRHLSRLITVGFAQHP